MWPKAYFSHTACIPLVFNSYSFRCPLPDAVFRTTDPKKKHSTLVEESSHSNSDGGLQHYHFCSPYLRIKENSNYCPLHGTQILLWCSWRGASGFPEGKVEAFCITLFSIQNSYILGLLQRFLCKCSRHYSLLSFSVNYLFSLSLFL